MKCRALLDGRLTREILLQLPEHIPKLVLGSERLPQACGFVPGKDELQSALDAIRASESGCVCPVFARLRHSGIEHENKVATHVSAHPMVFHGCWQAYDLSGPPAYTV